MWSGGLRICRPGRVVTSGLTLTLLAGMRGWVLAAVLSLGACTASSQPTPFSSPSAIAKPSPDSSLSPSPPVGVAPALNCRLPVISPTTSTDPVPGGWITLPGGQFTRDPASLPGRLQSHVPSYDRVIGRWVPVEFNYVAPDGASYILHGDSSLETNGFYLVDALTGTRRLVLAADGPPEAPGSWTVVQYAREGVYLWSAGIATVPGLWLLDPQTGTVRLVDSSHYWQLVGGGAAWALDPPLGARASLYNAYRLDLATGDVATWYQSNTAVSLLSPTPDGNLLIRYGEQSAVQIGLVTSSSQLVPFVLAPGVFVGAQGYLSSPGVWIPLRPAGIALYMKGIGVTIVAESPNVFNVAGDCQ
jgi:hypothetical protein